MFKSVFKMTKVVRKYVNYPNPFREQKETGRNIAGWSKK